jgi:hypothetical protein
MHDERCLLYESGELGREEAADFERHLKDCAECRELLALARRARRGAESLAETPPARLAAAVRARVRPAPAAAPWFARLRAPALAAAAACVGILIHAARRAPSAPFAAADLPRTETTSSAPRLGGGFVRAPGAARRERRRPARAAALADAGGFRLRGLDGDAATIHFARFAGVRPPRAADVVAERPAAFAPAPQELASPELSPAQL